MFIANIKKYRLEILVILLYVIGLSFIYPSSISNFNGDANSYTWIKSIYANNFSYFSQSVAAGYNLFAIIYVFSYLIGAFTYHSPTTFFLIANYAELILLCISSLMFIKLTGIEKQKFRQWLFILPLAILIWTIVSILTGGPSQGVLIQATDLYLLFVDTFIILSIAWFINIVNNYPAKVPLYKLIIFAIFSLYFASTTLRFINSAILTELILLGIFFIRNKNTNKKSTNKKPSKSDTGTTLYNPEKIMQLGILLIIIAIIGYFSFFALEKYSTSARFVLRGGELSTADAIQNAITASNQYFSGFNSPSIMLLRLAYLLTLFYGMFVACKLLFNYQLNLARIFALLTFINFGLVTFAGIFSHGTVFLDTGVIGHYYELSAIFAFLTITALTINLLDKYNYQLISIIGLSIISIFSIGYITTHKMQTPGSDLTACIESHKQQYKLQDGMSGYDNARLLNGNPSNTINYTVIGTMATNLDYNWNSNLQLPKQNVNFLVYTDNNYKQNTLALINSKIPALNYQDVSCVGDTGFVVFDAASANNISTFRNTEMDNARSWFYLTSYGSGQDLWGKMPWHKEFIKDYHEYNYYGSLFRRSSPSVQYMINPDLSQTVTGNSQSPILMTEMIHAGAGKYYLDANYSANGPSGVVVINLNTKQAISQLNLDNTTDHAHLDFSLDSNTPIALAIILAPTTNSFTLKHLTFGKYVPDN
jgi:hypothetical protein